MQQINYTRLWVSMVILFFMGCQNNQNAQQWFLPNLSGLTDGALPLVPGVVSTDEIEYGGGITEKYQEIYFTINDTTWQSSYPAFCRYREGRFLSRDTVRFQGKTMQGGDTRLSPDGDRLFIASRFSEDTLHNDGNIWVAHRTPEGWSKMEKLPLAINSELGEYSPSQANSGNLYFTRFSEATSGDIFVSRYQNGVYKEAEKLPESVNSDQIDCDSWVSPDESFILFVRKPLDGFGSYDLYISFHIDGDWTKAQNLGASYNTPATEGSPSVTNDNKYLIFTSNRRSEDLKKFDGKLDVYIQAFDLESVKAAISDNDQKSASR